MGYINPENNFFYAWSFLLAIVYVVNMVVISARIAFTQLQSSFYWNWVCVDAVFDMVYLLDGVFMLHLAYFRDGLLITDSKDIVQYNFQLSTTSDALCLLPVEILVYIVNNLDLASSPDFLSVYLPLSRLNRLLKKSRFQHTMRLVKVRFKHPYTVDLLVLASYVLLIVHLNACCYYFVSRLIGVGTDAWVYPSDHATTLYSTLNSNNSDNNNNEKQLNNNNSNNSNNTNTIVVGRWNVTSMIFHQYIYCYHWALLILTNRSKVPPPQYDLEVVMMVVNFVVGLLVIATIVGNVSEFVTGLQTKNIKLHNEADTVIGYAKHCGVDRNLMNKLGSWFEYVRMERPGAVMKDVFIDSNRSLPDQILHKLNMATFLDTLHECKTLEDLFGKELGYIDFLKDMVELMDNPVLYSPGDNILEAGEPCTKMYIVHNGTAIGMNRRTHVKGAVLGMLYTPSRNSRYVENVSCIGYVTCLPISVKIFQELVREYKFDNCEKWVVLVDEMVESRRHHSDASNVASDPVQVINQSIARVNKLSKYFADFLEEFRQEANEINDEIERLK